MYAYVPKLTLYSNPKMLHSQAYKIIHKFERKKDKRQKRESYRTLKKKH